jgi:intein-encoded DNA endonuclease-like protein
MHEIGQSAGKTWAYLIGVYLGDGCVTDAFHKARGRTYPVFRLNTIDSDFARATKEALDTFTDYSVSIHTHAVSKSSKPNWSLRCGDPRICEVLVTETDGKAKLPEWIFTADTETRLAFIAGLMDSEGYVCLKEGRGQAHMGFKSTDLWFYDFLRLLQSVGILHGKIGVEKPRKPGYRVPRRVTIKMRSWVDAGAYFRIARKQERVERWAAMPYLHVPSNLRGHMSKAA